MGGGGLKKALLGRAVKKRFAVLPTLLTIGNVVCGFGSISYAGKWFGNSDPESALLFAALLIYLAMIFDALDGSAARWTKQTSEFGAQLDSLCDAVSFGAAPALLMLQFSQPHGYPARLLWVIGALYVACAVLRLARFNVQTGKEDDHRFFRGLPSPAAGGMVASFPLMVYGLRRWDSGMLWDGLSAGLEVAAIALLPLVTMAVAILMVSRVRYVHVFQHMLGRRRSGRYVIQLVFLAAVMFILPQVSVPLVFGWYVFAAPMQALQARLAKRGEVPQPTEPVPQPDPGVGGDLH